MKIEISEELINDIKRVASLGCADGFCKFTGRATGMHTNGGCHCSALPGNSAERSPHTNLVYLASLIRKLAANISEGK